MDPISFETHPSRYRHWKLSIEGELARLALAVDSSHPLAPGYDLKLNSYDLSVDIELHDAIMRLRFEHPKVRSVILSGSLGRTGVLCWRQHLYVGVLESQF